MFCSKCGANVPDSATFCSACGQPTGGVTAAPAAAHVQPTVVYAGFWLRFVAWIIDRVLLQVASWIIFIPFAASFGFENFMRGGEPRPEDIVRLVGTGLRLACIVIIVAWLYYALMESSSWQGTLGKKALGLEVTDMAGNRVSFGRATGRYFGRIISGLILGIGFIMAGFTERKQALHDMLASCLVIRKV